VKKFLKRLWVNALPRDLFDPLISVERARELFRRYVEVVEIENHSFCNRTCWFCPNSFLDRKSGVKLAPPELLEKVLRDLKSIDYDRTLVWSRYHEPLGHESIYENLAKARRELPRAILAMVSNGDYLNKERVQKLADAGLNRMMLDLYLPDGKEEDDAEFEKAFQKFLERTGLTPKQMGERYYRLEGSSTEISLMSPVYRKENISTRGGLLKIPKAQQYHRTAACLVPIRQVVIDYNGKGMLCCQVRSDAPEHQNAVIGDLMDPEYSLFHFYRDLAGARKGLLQPGAKKGVCESCDMSDASNEDVALSESWHGVLSAIPGAGFLTSLGMRRDRFEF
jgi:hypothetical protein